MDRSAPYLRFRSYPFVIMTVTTRSSAGGASAQSHSTTPGSTMFAFIFSSCSELILTIHSNRTSTRKPKKTRSQWTPEASTAGSGRRGGKRNIPSRDSDGEDDIDADDEQHPPECSPPVRIIHTALTREHGLTLGVNFSLNAEEKMDGLLESAIDRNRMYACFPCLFGKQRSQHLPIYSLFEQ